MGIENPNGAPVFVATEAVLFDSPESAQHALQEVRNAHDHCPTGPTNSNVADVPDLTYTFAPRLAGSQRGFPFILVFVLVVFPLALLALVAYAYSKVANRPEWEDFLVGVLSAQLLVWLVTGTNQCYWLIRSSYRPFGVVLKFTRAHVWHGIRVCDLEQVRGLRLFVYSPVEPVPAENPTGADDPPPPKRAALTGFIR